MYEWMEHSYAHFRSSKVFEDLLSNKNMDLLPVGFGSAMPEFQVVPEMKWMCKGKSNCSAEVGGVLEQHIQEISVWLLIYKGIVFLIFSIKFSAKVDSSTMSRKPLF
ncbi:hypothetical protein Pfo_020736, partial [Paulownia fortunei]